RRVWWARALVNATGPWVKQFFDDSLQAASPRNIRLIKGSHIVVPRVNSGPQAYILQNEDHRIVFVIPWLDKFSIIGTTDVEYHGDPRAVQIDESEIDYLLGVYNRHFSAPLRREDVRWHYAGVRPLCDDESDSPQAVTRDYTLELADWSGKAPLLSVFGGKLTTYRKLAQAAMHRLQPYFPEMGPDWTAQSVLPGGEMGMDRRQYSEALCRDYPWLPADMAYRYACTYGARSRQILRGAESLEELGQHFGHDLYQAEIRYLQTQEWAQTAEDMLWRRTKLGMFLTGEEQAHLAEWLDKQGKLSAVA
ncbi:MAG: glycerol-3-phosphate dehydrogenase, partial [Plesiomonas shigelloides]